MAFAKVKKVWRKIDPEVISCIAGIALVLIGLWFVVDKWFIHAFTYDYTTIFGTNALAVDNIINHDWVGIVFLTLGVITFIKNK